MSKETVSKKLQTVAENQQKVYDTGYNGGYNRGYNEGKQAEYNAFWDSFQEGGERTDYSYAFRIWHDAEFKPKHDIRPTDGTRIFNGTGIKDIVGALNSTGAVLDFSQCTTISMAFYSSRELETIPTVDTTATTDDSSNASGTFYYLFGNCPSLKSIEKIILKQSGSQEFNRPFNFTPELQEVRFEGVIGQNGLAFNESTKLSKASIESVINALSTTTSDLTVTFSRTAVNNAFEGGVDGAEWQALIATKPNWTISLV